MKKPSPRFYGAVCGFFLGITISLLFVWKVYDSHNHALDEYYGNKAESMKVPPLPLQVLESVFTQEQVPSDERVIQIQIQHKAVK